jgi:DNA-binding CsgD family transcriptional regulator
MSMVAHASCLHSMIMRRLGRLEEAADAARLALDFKLATSPPLAVAWAAGLCIDPLTCLGRLDDADAIAGLAAGREPPEGWIHTLVFRQARGALRVARHRPDEALADHGARLRRSGQRTQARPPLLRALDLAERTGAAGLAAEVKRELLAAGARPRRTALTGPDALTAGERRVAALAAEGASNRQIAEHLFITQATVETHLRHAFRKLNITSRAELPVTADT